MKHVRHILKSKCKEIVVFEILNIHVWLSAWQRLYAHLQREVQLVKFNLNNHRSYNHSILHAFTREHNNFGYFYVEMEIQMDKNLLRHYEFRIAVCN